MKRINSTMEFDLLIVGAGFAGIVVAERLASQYGLNSLIVEKRSHIGGNSYDHYDDHGVLIHAYGPHYFRTDSDHIKDYLGMFTEWRPVDYTIKSYTDGKFWSFPINLNTFEEMLGRESSKQEMEEWLISHRVPIEHPANSEEVIISQVGEELYEKFFKGYTIKQWKRHPRQLDASVCGRIPIRTSRDDRYLREKFQALPRAGYTQMFNRLLEACGNRVKLLLQTDYREVVNHVNFRHLVYTGAIDEFFNLKHGPLPYRSLRFERESFSPEQLVHREQVSGKAGFWQPAMQINYPNEEDFTRIVEIKHATGQACTNTTIVREYPDDYGLGKEPYYPIPAPDAARIYQKYKEMADATPNTSFIGRLATYRYYNMDQVVSMALIEAKRISRKLGVNN